MMADDTLLQREGVRQRMRCSARTVSRIVESFVTVEKPVAAIEADEPLTDHDQIGPRTASKSKWMTTPSALRNGGTTRNYT